jgi:glycosyltransferase involved in cell wall biosynthesis
MNILATGQYEPEYNRNLVIFEGLRALPGVRLETFPYTSRRQVDKARLRALCEQADWIFLPSFTHADVPFLRGITRKPIAFDPLVSRYLTKVFDYKTVWRYSPRALKNYWKDARAFRNCDLIFADTEAHKQYFVRTFGVAPERIEVLPVGVDVSNFYPVERLPEERLPEDGSVHPFVAGFYGNFIPLQGVMRLLEAARLLRERGDIRFELIGDGFEFEEARKKVAAWGLGETVHLAGRAPYGELNARINRFDVAMGIFGDTPKADLVVPNKVFHYAACARPIITKDTPAIREVFSEREALLVPADPARMAGAILWAKAHREEAEAMGKRACAVVQGQYSEAQIAQVLVGALRRHAPFQPK